MILFIILFVFTKIIVFHDEISEFDTIFHCTFFC